METVVRVRRVGWRAQAALERAEGRAAILATLSDSIYLTVAGEILWLGRVGATLHGRAVLTPTLPAAPGTALALDVGSAACWRPPVPEISRAAVPAILARCRTLAQTLTAGGPADGLGVLLAGATPPFPLDGAVPAARALAQACADDDPRAATRAAEALIGLGPGLTPAGDDYVGGAFFARALLGPAATGDAGGWAAAAARVRALAAERTHPISAALLADLLGGEGHAPLHDLGAALAAGAPLPTALAAARRLARLGHSSGWDMLAGFVGALLGAPGV